MREHGKSLVASLVATDWIQGTEAMGRAGMTPELWDRMRLDQPYREALMAKAAELDKEIAGRKYSIVDEYPINFESLLARLRNSCHFGDGRALLLRNDIMEKMCALDFRHLFEGRDFLVKDFFTMPLYKRMRLADVQAEMRRRNLKSAGAVEGIFFALKFGCLPAIDGFYVLDAIYREPDSFRTGELLEEEMLSVGNNGYGNPTMSLHPRKTIFVKGDHFLVKRKT